MRNWLWTLYFIPIVRWSVWHKWLVNKKSDLYSSFTFDAIMSDRRSAIIRYGHLSSWCCSAEKPDGAYFEKYCEILEPCGFFVGLTASVSFSFLFQFKVLERVYIEIITIINKRKKCPLINYWIPLTKSRTLFTCWAKILLRMFYYVPECYTIYISIT